MGSRKFHRPDELGKVCFFFIFSCASPMQEANLKWTCDQCGNPNEADTWPCDKCRYPLVHNKGQHRKHVRGKLEESQGDQNPATDEKKWYCSHCKHVNPSTAKRCEKCFADKKANKAAFLQARQSTSNFRKSMENLFPAFHTKSFQDQAFHAEELKEKIPVKGDKWKNISSTSSFSPIADHDRF